MRDLALPPRRTCRRRRQRPHRRLAEALIAVALTLLPAGAAHADTIAAGSLHTCAVTTTGGVQCWGENEAGQLGDGTTTSSSRPVAVTGIGSAIEVSAGQRHSCALLANRTVRCWGIGLSGVLGDGTAESSTVPVTVAGLSDAIAIDSEGFINCALRATGSLACWGADLGYSATPWSSIVGADQAPTDALDVSVGKYEVCAVGATSTRCWSSLQIDVNGGHPTPFVRSPASDDVQQTEGSGWFGCVLLASSQVGCEGYNSRGQLGNGTTGNLWSSDLMPRGRSVALGLDDARAVVTFQDHACALRATGAVACWGPTRGGVPGGGPGDFIVSVPTDRPDLPASSGLTAGDHHGCTVGTAGTVRCWGFNGGGQLGDGTLVSRGCAKLVAGLQVAASARGAVTPVRRDGPHVSVPEPPRGTTPLPTTPPVITCDHDPWGPSGTTPSSTTPTSTTPRTPGLEPGMTPPTPLAPKLLLVGRAVVVTAFRVPPRWAGSCPRTAKVSVQALGRTASKTLRVRASQGLCEVSGRVRLRGRLARATRVVVKIRPRGGATIVRAVSAA